jgi:hypothetical protein
MHQLCLTVLTIAAIALPPASLAADFSGHWRHFERDAIRIPPATYDHSADFIFWQRGDRVYGTWSESGHRESHGCVKGVAKGRLVQVQMCLQAGSFGSERAAVCPKYSPSTDRFDLSRKTLTWYRYNDAAGRWERYVTLTKRNSLSTKPWPKECGAADAGS